MFFNGVGSYYVFFFNDGFWDKISGGRKNLFYFCFIFRKLIWNYIVV